MNKLEEYGYAGLYKALKHKYKYALSTNLPCVSRRSQFLALLCIFPELISLQESMTTLRWLLKLPNLFAKYKGNFTVYRTVASTLGIRTDIRHQNITKERETDHVIAHWRYLGTVKCKVPNTKYCSAKSKFRYLLSIEFVINQSTINFKSGQSVLAIHDSPPYYWDQWGHTTFTITSNDFQLR